MKDSAPVRVMDDSQITFKNSDAQVLERRAISTAPRKEANKTEEEDEDADEDIDEATVLAAAESATSTQTQEEPEEEVVEDPDADDDDVEPVKVSPDEDLDDNAVASSETFRLLEMNLDDAGEELKQDGFYEKLSGRDIAKMDPYSKRILHNLRVEYKRMLEAAKGDSTKLKLDYEKKMAAVSRRERELAIEREKLNAWINDPKVQEQMEIKESELPPANTPEGIQAHIDHAVAKTIKQRFTPMQEQYAKLNREADYRQFYDAHPAMQDEGFRKEMAKMIRDRFEAGKEISWEDAHDLVQHRRGASADQNSRARQLKARQGSAQKVSKKTNSGTVPEPKSVPPEVKKKGALAVAKYLQQHPKVAQAVRNNRH